MFEVQQQKLKCGIGIETGVGIGTGTETGRCQNQTPGSVSKPSVPESTSFQSSLSSLVELILGFSMIRILPAFVKM